MENNLDNIELSQEALEVDAKIAALADTSEETENNDEIKLERPKDYVTYTITADELKDLSAFEASEFAAKKRETLYTAVHRLVGDKCRNFQLGAVVASNGAIDPNEPLAIVYRRPLNANERLSDFKPEQIADGQVVETAHLALGSSLATRLFYAATIFAPLYNALRSQYSIHHIYNMAGRLASTVIVGDPSTYYKIDQSIGNGIRHEDEQMVAYRMIYVGMAQTNEVVTRTPAIVGYRVCETNVSSNIAEVFPVVMCGRRIGFNTYLNFDCVFEEPSIRLDREDDELEVEDVSYSEMVTLVNSEKSIQHVNRKTGTLI